METHKSREKSSHLFTIFRMNPTVSKKRRKTEKKYKYQQKQQQQQQDDSDCDSGVDVQETIPSKKENSLLDDFFTSQYSSAVYLDNISTPSSVIDQNMFSSLDWPIPQFNNELYFDTNYLDNLFLPSSFIPQDPSYLLYDQ